MMIWLENSGSVLWRYRCGCREDTIFIRLDISEFGNKEPAKLILGYANP